MREFCNTTFEGDFYEVKKYLIEYHSKCVWDCSKGYIGIENIINVLSCGCEPPQDKRFEVDIYGNIRVSGELQVFAYAKKFKKVSEKG